jgi:DNA replication ATP-dependent helicase Dna2
MISKEEHLRFFDLEINTQLKEWEAYLHQRFNALLNAPKKELFLGRIISLKNDGSILIRCKKGSFPRFNWQYYFQLVGPDVKGDPNTWSFTFKEYKESEKPKYSLNAGSNGVVTYFSRADLQFVYFGATLEDSKFLDYLENKLLTKGIQPLISISKTFPPIDYLKNLKAYVGKSNNQILQYTREVNKWNPINLANNEINDYFLIEKLIDKKLLVIQGPPGTGKSYQAALICKAFIEQDKSVGICALTNRALIEIASQPGLKLPLKEGKVFKTNCSKAEINELPGLLDYKEIKVLDGAVILSTYYKLSSFYSEQETKYHKFDLLIIEEASQAFLSTLAMFSELAEQVLIIGDQMQLPPVVQSHNDALLEINKKLYDLIDGFDSLTWNAEPKYSYRFAQTRRLTEASAKLTGLFYENALQSCSPLNNINIHANALAELFGDRGSINIAKIPLAEVAQSNPNIVINKIRAVVEMIKQKSPLVSISILSFKVIYEQKLIESLEQAMATYSSILVSTVHRVQGITADYTIYFMPLEEVNFELNPNLFNVATSRAKKGTLLVTFDFIEHMELNPVVKRFLSLCNDVTESFINLKT